MARTKAADRKFMGGSLPEFMKGDRGVLQKAAAWLTILVVLLSVFVSAGADVTSILCSFGFN